ncbi:hypothetical protein GCM10009676_23560 [Prauserella halophila]|uniref:Choice-of-anchor G family protein n=1 Tax=Prauserella halophila TaxID=185641 RepID=A0ABP4GTX3_9PSEU|nr:choice-of-anchor P family protein [Prauserella halophila]MCP2235456.1 hypothetical protein [Prauserella halophila]
MSKKKTAALGAGVLSAALVGGALLAPAAGAQTEDSAFGIAADGLIDIAPTPYVEGEGSEEVVGTNVAGLAGATVLSAEASSNYAYADVANLSVLPGDIGGIPGIGEPLVAAEGTLSATCDNGDLSSQITELSVLGNTIPIDNLAPNTTAVPEALEGVAQITLNKQSENTVTAVSIELLQGVPGLSDIAGQTIDIASATCTEGDDDGDNGDGDNGDGDNGDGDNGNGDNGNGDGDNGNGDGDNGNGDGDNGDGDGDGDGDQADDNGDAPAPTPQPGHLDVTG